MAKATAVRPVGSTLKATEHDIPPALLAQVTTLAADNKLNDASPLIAAWFTEVVADELRAARCDLCEKKVAVAPALDLRFMRGASEAWSISYLFHCTDEACSQDAIHTFMKLRKEWEAAAAKDGHAMQHGCFECLSTDDLLMNVGNGAFYCPRHRPPDAKPVAVCAQCGARRDTPRLAACTGCRTVSYCGHECQRQHWPRHKAACGVHRRKKKKEEPT